MPSSLFFVRLVANRPNFAMSMTADEQAAMRAHSELLQAQTPERKVSTAGPVEGARRELV